MQFDSTVLTAVENTQMAKSAGEGKVASDQGKAAAIALAISQDLTDQTVLNAAADKDIDAAVTMLTSLRSVPAQAIPA